MARWGLQATRTGTAGDAVELKGVSDGTYLYFAIDSSGNSVVYRWGGSTFTDISGSTFNGLTIAALCIFNGDLYARVLSGSYPSYTPYVYKYSSGQSWNVVWTGSSLSISLSSAFGDLESDSTQIILLNRHNGGVDIHRSTDGTTWVEQTANGGSFPDTTQHLVGTSRETHSEVLVVEGGDVWAYSSGDDWQKRATGSYEMVGYANFKSWHAQAAAAVLRHSTDWGATTTTSSGSSNFEARYTYVQGFLPATLAWEENDNEVYIYDSLADSWSSDGIPSGGNDILLVFSMAGNIYALLQDGDDAKIYSRFPHFKSGSETRLLGIGADEGRLYLTGNVDGTLKLWVFDLDLAFLHDLGFGSATFVELDNRTRGIFPVAKPANDGVLLVWGRDGNNKQVYLSDDQGRSVSDVSDGGWGTSKYAVALLIDPLDPANMVAVFSDDDIYLSMDGGSSWTKTADAPVVQREAARHPVDQPDLILAGQGSGAGELDFSPNYGLSTDDISDASIGTVNAIEVSR